MKFKSIISTLTWSHLCSFQAAISTQKSPGGVAPINEGRFLLHVSTLTELVPFLYISVLESGPYMDQLAEEMSSIGDNEGR